VLGRHRRLIGEVYAVVLLVLVGLIVGLLVAIQQSKVRVRHDNAVCRQATGHACRH
jgi:uncharacterized protein HemY